MKFKLIAVIPLVAAMVLNLAKSAEYEAPVIDPSAPYDPSAKIFLPPGAPRNMLPYIHREIMPHLNFIPSDMDQDIDSLIRDKSDYVTWEYMFTDDFLQGLEREMKWIE
jgi:hypothetical protein